MTEEELWQFFSKAFRDALMECVFTAETRPGAQYGSFDFWVVVTYRGEKVNEFQVANDGYCDGEQGPVNWGTWR